MAFSASLLSAGNRTIIPPGCCNWKAGCLLCTRSEIRTWFKVDLGWECCCSNPYGVGRSITELAETMAQCPKDEKHVQGSTFGIVIGVLLFFFVLAAGWYIWKRWRKCTPRIAVRSERNDPLLTDFVYGSTIEMTVL